MERRYTPPPLDLEPLHAFLASHGEVVTLPRGERMEIEGQPAQWFALVEQGIFKYVTRNPDDQQEHIAWFSLVGEFVTDYPNVLYGRPARFDIETMTPCRVCRIDGEALRHFFGQNDEQVALRCLIGEHLLAQFQSRYIDLHRLSPRERYTQLLRRCPGIADDLPLNAIASFLGVTPVYLSRIRRAITFGEDELPPPIDIPETSFIDGQNEDPPFLYRSSARFLEERMI